MEVSSNSPLEEERRGRLCTVTQVEETKLLLGMVPMWMTFLVYSLVKSTGENFFVEQATMTGCDKNIIALCLIKSLVSLAISSLYESIVAKKLGEAHKRNATLVRIGLGMLSSLCCCIVAWRVEAWRLSLVAKCKSHHESMVKSKATLSMFVPQFCCLGLMEGLAEDGINEFFYLQVSKRMEGYGPVITRFVIGVGNLVSALSIYASRRWFTGTLNDSRLDKYYQMLAIFSYINLGCYWYVSKMYTSKKTVEGHVQLIIVTPKPNDVTGSTS